MWADRSSDPEEAQQSQARAPAGATAIAVLYVEDDDAIRDVTAMILQDEGFAVVSVLSAEDAMERMREQTFDVVLTDHNLPGNSGAWLLDTAAQNGLLAGASGLVLTACTGRIEVGPAFPVLRKPLEFSDLISSVHDAASRARSGLKTRFSLYVSASAASIRARRNLSAYLLESGLDAGCISVHVVEPGCCWAQADADHVLEVPVLVRHGRHRARLLGDLSDRPTLADFLQQAEGNAALAALAQRLGTSPSEESPA